MRGWCVARVRRGLLGVGTLVLAVAGACLVLGCATIDLQAVPREPSSALSDPSGTLLHAQVAPLLREHPGLSGFVALRHGLDAFVARSVLADAAQRTLDLQYYIVRGDTSGQLLLGRVYEAAERGVRVRLLIDDWTLADADDALAQLDAHPLVEVRLFNPTANRVWFSVWRWLEVASDFARINRRMHNKAWIADNTAAIVGGRNIGDEYFEAHDDLDFTDLDLLSVGPVVSQASDSFDRYWNSEFAVPLSTFQQVQASEAQRQALRRWFAQRQQQSADTAFLKNLRSSGLAAAIQQARLEFIWGEARILADDPAKLALREDDPALRSAQRGLLLAGQLVAWAPKAQRELLLVSPYFVPGRSGVASLAALEHQGVQVRVLTNSLASNDVVPTQAGYARYRSDLLRAGVDLFELKPRSSEPSDRRRLRDVVSGSSRAALHEKSFVVDREWVFVGSLNLDPRSLWLNAEIGVLVRSPELAAQLAASFEHNTAPERAWKTQWVDGVVEWVDQTDGQTTRYVRDPEASLWRRMMQIIYQIVAPESLL